MPGGLPIWPDHRTATASDPAERIHGPRPQKRLRAVKEGCDGRNRIFHRQRIHKACLAEQPERLCLYFPGCMIQKRSNIWNAFFPSVLLSCQYPKRFIQLRYVQSVISSDRQLPFPGQPCDSVPGLFHGMNDLKPVTFHAPDRSVKIVDGTDRCQQNKQVKEESVIPEEFHDTVREYF